MITVPELDSYVDAGLDATGSQRYLFDQDKIPAYNSAISRAITAGNWALANKKGSEEALHELKEDRIFQSNTWGGISINSVVPTLGHTVWTVLAIYAEPTGIPTIAPVNLSGAKTYLINSVPVGFGKPVQRMTAEQGAIARDNMYMSGNEVLALDSSGNPGPMRTYGYYYMGHRASDTVETAQGGTYFITPYSLSSRKPFWVSYLRTPTTISTVNDTIDLPQSMKRTLASWALEYITWKQGDGTTLHSVVEKDAAQLFNFQSL